MVELPRKVIYRDLDLLNLNQDIGDVLLPGDRTVGTTSWGIKASRDSLFRRAQDSAFEQECAC